MRVIKWIFKALNYLVFVGIHRSFPDMNRSRKSFIHFGVFLFLGFLCVAAWLESQPWLWIVAILIGFGFTGDAWEKHYKKLPAEPQEKKTDITVGVTAAPKNRKYFLNPLSTNGGPGRKRKKLNKKVSSRRRAKIIKIK